MNYKDYVEKKDKGLSEIVKAGSGYAIAFKRWDEETGEVEEPEIQAVDLDELASKKEELQKEIADIDLVVADCKILDK